MYSLPLLKSSNWWRVKSNISQGPEWHEDVPSYNTEPLPFNLVFNFHFIEKLKAKFPHFGIHSSFMKLQFDVFI